MVMYRVANLDVLHWQGPVADKDLTSPPGTPAKGDRYIIGTSATGGWAGHDLEVAYYTGSAWVFIAKEEGQISWVKDENLFYFFNGTAWAALPTSAGGGATLGVSSGTTVTIPNDAEKSTNLTAYTKLKEIKINEATAGHVTVQFSVRSGSTGDVSAKVCVNGAIIGADEVHTGTGSETFEADVLNLQVNDLVQVYGKKITTGNLCCVKNMRLIYNWTIRTIDGETLVAPLGITKTTPFDTTNQDP
ncbi:MAG: DUF2793 domain-containing protein [Methanosarcinaceae archaeon]|nr:DUF2793 domain-containing protein [Methanosarcinaceae archaeon]